MSAPQSIRLNAAAHTTRQLYGVLVGNDVYSNPKFTLKYARHDAERLGATLEANTGNYYAKANVKVLTDSAATRDAIRAEIEKSVIAAGPTDTIVFSFAGHGLQDASNNYFLTPFGFEETNIGNTALAWRDIAALLHKAKSRVIVILDACHAGLSGSEGVGTNDDAVNALLAGDHPPMLVLAASKGRQSSLEGDHRDGGAFTTALIETLRSKRADYDFDRDEAIELSELYQGLRTILARETRGEQTPWLVRQDLLGDFVVF